MYVYTLFPKFPFNVVGWNAIAGSLQIGRSKNIQLKLQPKVLYPM